MHLATQFIRFHHLIYREWRFQYFEFQSKISLEIYRGPVHQESRKKISESSDKCVSCCDSTSLVVSCITLAIVAQHGELYEVANETEGILMLGRIRKPHATWQHGSGFFTSSLLPSVKDVTLTIITQYTLGEKKIYVTNNANGVGCM
jgi:hypothetical protein